MKKLIPLIISVIFLSTIAYAQNVFAVEYANQSAVKVFVVKCENHTFTLFFEN